MRNYIRTRAIKYHITYDDGMGGGGDLDAYSIAGDDNELMSNVQKQNTDFQAGLPAGYTATFQYPLDPQNLYFMFIKETVVKLLQLNPDLFYNDAVGAPGPTQILRSQFEVSPRQTWHPDRSIHPPKKSDFTGAAGLLQALAALPTLAATFTREGRLRDAGIVLYAYNQVIKHSWSITEALAYVQQNINF